MRSEAARARALRRGPGFAGFLLAHHWPGQLDRCYQMWVGQYPLWLCARCSGVYPALFATLVIQLIWAASYSPWDWPWLFGLPLVAVADWAFDRLNLRASSNFWRTASGFFLGVSLGRGVYLNMIHPFNTRVVVQLLVLVGIVISVEIVARLTSTGRRPKHMN